MFFHHDHSRISISLDLSAVQSSCHFQGNPSYLPRNNGLIRPYRKHGGRHPSLIPCWPGRGSLGGWVARIPLIIELSSRSMYPTNGPFATPLKSNRKIPKMRPCFQGGTFSKQSFFGIYVRFRGCISGCNV